MLNMVLSLTRNNGAELVDLALGVGLPLLMLCLLLIDLSRTLCLLRAAAPTTDCLGLTVTPFVFFIGLGVG